MGRRPTIRRSYPTGRLLWAIFALALFTPSVFFNPLPGVGDYRLVTYFRLMWERGYDNSALFGVAIGQALLLALPALAFGWLAQAVAVVCGVRLTRRLDPAQAADYEDKPAAP